MPNWKMLGEALAEQKKFSDLFFDSQKLNNKQKEELLKTFALSLHSEASSICEAVNYKDHRKAEHPVDIQKILYKSVDAYRYILAMLNLWGLNEDEFASALQQKDDYLHYRNDLGSKNWTGEPVVLFDLDDVLAEFRVAFCKFVTDDSGIFIDPNSHEYYNIATFKANGLSNERYFKSFIESHGFKELELNQKYFDLMNHLKASGFWIHVVTARPDSLLPCFYDTYSWLARHSIPADGVAFTAEKFSWLTHQPFYNSMTQVFAVDDSAKHAAEYAKHSVPVLVPEQPYNREVKDLKGITYVPKGEDPIGFISKISV